MFGGSGRVGAPVQPGQEGVVPHGAGILTRDGPRGSPRSLAHGPLAGPASCALLVYLPPPLECPILSSCSSACLLEESCWLVGCACWSAACCAASFASLKGSLTFCSLGCFSGPGEGKIRDSTVGSFHGVGAWAPPAVVQSPAATHASSCLVAVCACLLAAECVNAPGASDGLFCKPRQAR